MRRMLLAWLALAFATPLLAQDLAAGKTTFEGGCVGCHGTGVLGAPKVGDAAAWKARAAAAGGLAGLVANAKAGKGAMPPRGAMPVTDAQITNAVAYMLAQSAGGAATAAAAKPAAATASAVPVAAPAGAAVQGVNAFNRLLRPPAERNRPPTLDGIHDAANDGTQALQPPLTAFNDFVHSNAGNRVDWVKTLRESRIQPRADRTNPAAQPMVMDLNIVREVKGSMPDVVYPHKQHTEWLDCSNCHPAIFKPQKGANQISMAGILLGEACGVCHGKVAFPVSECRLCHSKPKQSATVAAPAAAGAAK